MEKSGIRKQQQKSIWVFVEGFCVVFIVVVYMLLRLILIKTKIQENLEFENKVDIWTMAMILLLEKSRLGIM